MSSPDDQKQKTAAHLGGVVYIPRSNRTRRLPKKGRQQQHRYDDDDDQQSSSSSPPPVEPSLQPPRSRHSNQKQQTHQRQQQPERRRFHGAFTGGFSAGYFNTVGSKEGWKPAALRQIGKEQSVEDFMDEEDYHEWGGPTGIRMPKSTTAGTAPPAAATEIAKRGGDAVAETDASSAAATAVAARGEGDSTMVPPRLFEDDSRLLDSILTVRTDGGDTYSSVGKRLLRVLGWRREVSSDNNGGDGGGGDTAFVPLEGNEEPGGDRQNTSSAGGDFGGDDDIIHLSNKRLRRIKLQQSKTLQDLPPPKQDQCGLGFEAFQDAPEFLQYKRQRQQQSQRRVIYNNAQNTYRMPTSSSTEATSGGGGGGGGDTGATQSSSRSNHHHQQQQQSQQQLSQYLSYETVEDFVGTKSAGGFNLRDDDDYYDVMDDDNGVDAVDKIRGGSSGDHPLLKNLAAGGESTAAAAATTTDGMHPPSSILRQKGVGGLNSNYNTEVYEHVDSGSEDDDDDDEGHQQYGGSSSFSQRRSLAEPAAAAAAAPKFLTKSSNVADASKEVGEEKDGRTVAATTTNLFGSWAGTSTSVTSATSTKTPLGSATKPSHGSTLPTTTSDGKPILVGFVLGDGSSSSTTSPTTKRYTGPVLPKDFQLQQHQFDENDHPDILYTISRAVRLEQREEDAQQSRRRQQQRQQQDQIQMSRQHSKDGRQNEMASAASSSIISSSSTFSSSLAQAMKDRFTTATTAAIPLPLSSATDTSTNNRTHDVDRSTVTPSAGLYWPKQIVSSASSNQKADDDLDNSETVGDGEIKLSRTTQQFFPNPMLCKRFGVSPAVVQSNNSTPTVPVSNKTVSRKENEYFENEILPLATTDRKQRVLDINQGNQFDERTIHQHAEQFVSLSDRLDDEFSNRPPLDKLKSIFEADSDDDQSSEIDKDVPVDNSVVRDESSKQATQNTNKTKDESEQFVTVDIGDTKATSNALVVHRQGNTRKPVDTSSDDDQLSLESSVSSRNKKEKKRKRSKSRKKKKRRKEKDEKKTTNRRRHHSRSNSRVDDSSSSSDGGSLSNQETLKVDSARSILNDRSDEEKLKMKERKKKKRHRDRSREAKRR